jgi:RNA polymerase sigma-70 factor, ECF subfamily
VLRQNDEIAPALSPELAQHQAELTGHCYRILGSASETEDAVQETLVRAWRAFDRFEGRASPRTWLYCIATNVCLDMLTSRQRRARPIDLSPRSPADPSRGVTVLHCTGTEPSAESSGTRETDDPAELAIGRESNRLAFVTALRHLPPRQRAVLILRDVLRWTAVEVAELLETTVAAVNSALQRARSTLAARDLTAVERTQTVRAEHQKLLARYVDAFDVLRLRRHHQPQRRRHPRQPGLQRPPRRHHPPTGPGPLRLPRHLDPRPMTPRCWQAWRECAAP